VSAVDQVPAIDAPWQITYTPPQAARMLGVSINKLAEWRKRKLPDGTPLIASVKDGTSTNATTLITHNELVTFPERLRQLSGDAS
jgi:hypothetical protein